MLEMHFVNAPPEDITADEIRLVIKSLEVTQRYAQMKVLEGLQDVRNIAHDIEQLKTLLVPQGVAH